MTKVEYFNVRTKYYKVIKKPTGRYDLISDPEIGQDEVEIYSYRVVEVPPSELQEMELS
jgi:hypothetical protein